MGSTSVSAGVSTRAVELSSSMVVVDEMRFARLPSKSREAALEVRGVIRKCYSPDR